MILYKEVKIKHDSILSIQIKDAQEKALSNDELGWLINNEPTKTVIATVYIDENLNVYLKASKEPISYSEYKKIFKTKELK